MPVGPSGIIASAPRAAEGRSYNAPALGYFKPSAPGGYSTLSTDGQRTPRATHLAAYAVARPVGPRSSSAAATRARRTAVQNAAAVRPAEEKKKDAWGASAAAAAPVLRQQQNAYTSALASNSWLHRASTPGRGRPALESSPQAAAAAAQPQPQRPLRTTRVTLVLDLDETLVHSSFEPVEADLHIPVVMDGERYVAYVKKRPYMEEFLARCTELFDVVVWTASLAVYAKPLINELCRMSRIAPLRQMYRESCTQLPQGGYVKDLATMGRGLNDVCILDNSPSVAQLQPGNLIPIVSWYDDPRDTCLRDLLPHLQRLATCASVKDVIPSLPGASPQPW